jgi:hypothetical protein
LPFEILQIFKDPKLSQVIYLFKEIPLVPSHLYGKIEIVADGNKNVDRILAFANIAANLYSSIVG